MLSVLKKELKSYLLTPIGYVFIGIFLLIFSLFFYIDIFNYKTTNFEYLFYNGATILTFTVPVLTMRMFAEEKKNQTNQLILTSPVSMFSIVMGKLLAALLIVLITELFTFMYFIILKCFGNPSLQVALTTLLGFLLLACAYISLGMFLSSITESQVVAFVSALGAFLLMWFLPSAASVLEPFCLISKFDNFPQGIISVSEIITFVSFIVLFVLLTLIVLKNEKKNHG